MLSDPKRFLLRLLLPGLVLAGCGGLPESGLAPSEEPLGTQESALCSGLSVTSLSISGISSYQHELAGNGPWTVSTGANAVRLEYTVGGLLLAAEERTGSSGTWFYSGFLPCGAYTFQVKAYPMVIDSGGNRTTCFGSSRVATQSVAESCPGIVGGGYHSVALKSDGSVWAWGDNAYGNLGDGTTTKRLTPVQVTGLSGARAVAAGLWHTVALKNDGTVWTWGHNWAGQLGDGTTTNRYTPVKVASLTGIIAIDASSNHTMALKSDGTVWAWGSNGGGQLGDGTTTNRLTPVKVTNLTGVIAIAAGDGHSMALKSDGTVRTWGGNEAGQLGDGTTINRSTPVQPTGLTGVTALTAGAAHSLALKSDGTVRTWGANSYGQIGDGTTTNRLVPVQPTGLTSVASIGAGFYHSVVRRTDGTVRAWGSNWEGQLGDGTSANNRLTPVQSTGLTGVSFVAGGIYHSMMQKSDGTLRTVGDNGFGQLGDGTSTDRLTSVQVVGF